MKKILLLTGLMLLASTVHMPAPTIATNLPATNTVTLLSTNRASVYSVTLSSPKDTVIYFYDSDGGYAAPLFGTNGTNSAYIGRFTTNITSASSFVGSNGYTNWVTNVGVYTYTSTVAAASAELPKIGAMAVAAGTIQSKNVSWLFVRGITVLCSTNATIIIDYNTGN